MKSIILYLLFPLITLQILANGAAYIKFDGVNCESRDKGRIDVLSVSMRSPDNKGWSELLSFSQAVVHRNIADRNVKGKRDTAS